ncbi:MAG: hypothetical protein AAGD01_15730 [Acidobacteriota bacterium]
MPNLDLRQPASAPVRPTQSTEPSEDFRLFFTTQPPGAELAVVFLHGLDGHFWNTWGPEDAPGSFPLRLADELPHAAIALFDYPARLQRFLQDPDHTLHRIAQAWARHLVEDLFPRFSRIYILGYCLGGLITTLALRELEDEGRLPSFSEASEHQRFDVLLLDVPHRWPEGHLGFSKVFELDDQVLGKNAEFWQRQVEASGGLKPHILLSRPGSWITPMDPTAGLGSEWVHQLDLSHEELVQSPGEGGFETLEWVVECIGAEI